MATINYIAGDGSIGFTGDGGYATSAGFDRALRAGGGLLRNVYFAENATTGSADRRQEPDISTVVLATAPPDFSAIARTPPKRSEIPHRLGRGFGRNLYIADSAEPPHPQCGLGGSISTFAGNGTVQLSGDGRSSVQAHSTRPQAWPVDAAGNWYIADTLNKRGPEDLAQWDHFQLRREWAPRAAPEKASRTTSAHTQRSTGAGRRCLRQSLYRRHHRMPRCARFRLAEPSPPWPEAVLPAMAAMAARPPALN